LVDPKNKTEFAAKLEDLLINQATRERWRLWAAKEVQKYGYEKVVGQYEEFYKASLKKL
jgi:glycosyltransferase involved in cell wall biosynthesis